MAISTLQQEALQLSPDFNKQTEGIVRQTALYRANPPPPGEKPNDSIRMIYANVVRQPGAFGFVAAIVADAGWALTYDAWAADPEGAKGAIEAGVQLVWDLLLGIPQPPVVLAEEP